MAEVGKNFHFVGRGIRTCYWPLTMRGVACPRRSLLDCLVQKSVICQSSIVKGRL
jgi:hypothetical protein